MKTVMITAAGLTVVSMSLSASLWARDTDYPQQMAAVNRCYVEHIKSGRPPVTDPWADMELRDCMKRQGFNFCADCKVNGQHAVALRMGQITRIAIGDWCDLVPRSPRRFPRRTRAAGSGGSWSLSALDLHDARGTIRLIGNNQLQAGRPGGPGTKVRHGMRSQWDARLNLDLHAIIEASNRQTHVVDVVGCVLRHGDQKRWLWSAEGLKTPTQIS